MILESSHHQDDISRYNCDKKFLKSITLLTMSLLLLHSHYANHDEFQTSDGRYRNNANLLSNIIVELFHLH